MDYAKKKNDELSTLCKDRGLPHTGKKADFVKRLEEYDASHASSTSAAAPPAATGEDEIDWDDEPTAATEAAKAAASQPAADALAAGGVGRVKNPVAVPNQVQVEDPAETTEMTVIPPTTSDTPAATAPIPDTADTVQPAAATSAEETPAAEPEKEKSPEKDFNSLGLTDRTVAEELEKRKARALRFGLPVESEEIKLLERAKRFGAVDGSKLPGLLNQALSTGTKRGRSETAGGVEGAGVNKRRASGREGGRGGRAPGAERRQGSERPAGDRPTGEKRKEGGHASWMNDADRAKAEARKARFAAPA